MNKTIRPAKRIQGSITVPGDKSISHRALLLGALADGTTVISNLSPGKDVYSTRTCLIQLGIPIHSAQNVTVVTGKGLHGLQPAMAPLDAGNSGTTIRLLSGILAAQAFSSGITGDTSLRRRPMNRIMIPLRQMNADIETSPGGFAPLTIHGKPLTGIDYTLPVPSAQIKSCILLAGLFASGITRITEPAQSRDHTERMFPQFGVPVRIHPLTVEIEQASNLYPCAIDVPGDLSSAAYFIAAASMVPDSHLTIQHVGINPTRSGILGVMQKAGGSILEQNLHLKSGEPAADLTIRSGGLQGIEISGEWIPRLIDEIPVLAVLATQAAGRTVVRDAKELRVKETDRIAAIADNLRAMGVVVEMLEDGFVLEGPQKLKGASIDSRDDHRIAMAFSIAGLIADGETQIRHSECVDISYPGFFETLEKITDA